ncbi:polyamine (spermidine/putrescine) ABC transporter permease [Metamycoplasma cloacale]|uniref:ABC transporter permease n=1 Tax=Metamycoplasma cloacale TaxID=92401 RepID=A0A2Z4LM05_9BACT|nr:ABC transporter permease [Metamycoplasma cloacale]AWX42498.1 ABC transporter permease [Metamycoplasma cloacale]VEU79156.1 polyamine (spermidine/putrescine) ABC transporter permease [Metamycoplasma cloacale]
MAKNSMVLTTNKNSKSKKKHKFLSGSNKWQLSLGIPYLIFSILFIILPMVLIAIYAHKPLDQEHPWYTYKSANWEIAFKDSTFKIILRSILTGLVAATISLFIGFPYAYIISRSKSSIIKILGLSLVLSPLAIFTISKALALRGLFSAIFDDENKLNNYFFMILGMVYLFLPFMIMPLYQVLKDMPNNILEASQDLGYSKPKTMFKVIIPYSTKAILSGFGIILMMASTSIIISDKLLPNGSQKQLIGNLINQFANTANPFDLATASSLVLVTMVILLALYGIIYGIPYLISKKRGGSDE